MATRIPFLVRPFRMILLAAAALGLAIGTCAQADVADVLDRHILPGVETFAAKASDLAATAAADCSRSAVLPIYQETFDAWTAIADLRLGPSESAALSIAFWPDERGSGARTLQQLIATDDPALADPDAFARVSVAARGLFGLDLLLGDAALAYEPGDPGCTLVQTAAEDLARQARALVAGWADHADLLRNPGQDGNLTYLDPQEARSAVFSQIVAGLALTTDARLGRPVATLDRPRPTRAEAWRTGRPLANTMGSVRAAFAMAELLAGQPLPQSTAAFDAVERAAQAIADPTFQDIGSDSSAWLKLDILRQRVAALRTAIETELMALSGVTLGFNAADGD